MHAYNNLIVQFAAYTVWADITILVSHLGPTPSVFVKFGSNRTFGQNQKWSKYHVVVTLFMKAAGVVL